MQQTVSLSSLVQSKTNRRKTYKPGSIEGLADSMTTDGQLQQLVVRCRRGDKFEVLAGERRRRALRLRQERGEIAADHPVTVEVRHGLSALEAMRISLVENVQREDMDAIDEAESFAAMLATGAKLEDIAVQTGQAIEPTKLIAPMLARFMASDRGFAKAKRGRGVPG